MTAARARAPRAPKQDRAFRRRTSILDATARILDRDGYDALTTNAVAREAGAAIGTVYEYFGSREALLVALLARHSERLNEAIDAAIATGPADPLAIGDRVVDAFARVWREEPGYRGAWSARGMTALLERTGAQWGSAFSGRIEALLQPLLSRERRKQAPVVAFTAVHLVSGLLLAAMSAPPAMEPSIVRETKLALRAYLASNL